MPRDEVEQAIGDAKRARTEAGNAARSAEARLHELERDLDAAGVREAWGKARAWCEARGLADFYAWADRRGVAYARAHAEDSYNWTIFTNGCPLDSNCTFGDLATLRVGDVCVSVHCKDRLATPEVRIDGQAVIVLGDEEFEAPGPVQISSDAAALLVRASVVQLVRLMARMAIVPFDPRRDERGGCLDPVNNLEWDVPILNHRFPLGHQVYQDWMQELIDEFQAKRAREAAAE